MSDATARHGPDSDPDHTSLPDHGFGPGSGVEPAGDGGGDLVALLVARLRQAGLDPDAEGVCDALWLARW
ncbi:hypothetical protein, partial [Streptomyces sp. AF1A]|uniref:hypothetical protein n=1 Tax=Streptomyces sp. AF1A TaxID=3394350 RepID=UPI0039BCD71C